MHNISQDIFEQKYQYKEETIEQMWERIAKTLADVEEQEGYYTDFYRALEDFKFIPGGRILANVGTNRETATNSNCYVMRNVPDSMDGIFEVVKEAALTQQQGGGAGIYFGEIRPRGAYVQGCEAEASGPVSFMQVFDSSCRTVMASGNRRGAMLFCLPVWHPDVEEFIEAKTGNSLQMANLSVGITDAFMKAVKTNAVWDLVFDNKVYKTVKATDLWGKIMKHTYNHAEPGILYIDRINEQNNLFYCETMYTTNPCKHNLCMA